MAGVMVEARMPEQRDGEGVAADVEVIPIREVNKAYERMLKNDVRYRFVIDLASLKSGAS
jgi:alcohol dehydrogenase (NADP+)